MRRAGWVVVAAALLAPGAGCNQQAEGTGIEVQVLLVQSAMDQLQKVEVVASTPNGFETMASTAVADGVTAGTNELNQLVVVFDRANQYPFRDDSIVFQLLLPTSVGVEVKLMAYGRVENNSLLTQTDEVARTVLHGRMLEAPMPMACKGEGGACDAVDGGLGGLKSIDEVAHFEIHPGKPPAAVAVCHLTDATTADLVIGVPTAQGNISSTEGGRVLVYRGKGRTWSGSISTTPGTIGGPDLVIVGTQDAQQLGAAVACGKLTGGTFDDLVIGSPQAEGGAGRVYVFSDAATTAVGVTLGVPLPPLDGGVMLDGGVTGGMAVVHGPAPGAKAGSALAVARLGGVRPTLVIGAPGAAGGNGAVYLVGGDQLGATPGPPLGAGTGVVLPGVAGERLGTALATGPLAGPPPGTVDDIAIGAPGATSATTSGAVYVLAAGQATNASDAGVLEPTSMVEVLGPAPSSLGQAILIGDLDQDGTLDLALATPRYLFAGDTDRGAVWVLEGGAGFFGLSEIDLAGPTQPPPQFLAVVGGQFNSALFGTSTALVVSGSASQRELRKGNLWVGSSGMDSNRGLAILVIGRNTLSGTFDTSLEGAVSLKVQGTAVGDRLGAAVAAGALGQDNTTADLVVTAPGVQENGSAAGVVYGIMDQVPK